MRSARRPARSEVVALVAGFLAVQVALVVAIEVARPGVRDPNFGRKLELLLAKLRAHPDRPLCLAVGSSRTMNGLRPADLPPLADRDGRPVTVFNFGIPMCGPVQERLTLERVLARGVRPRWLVLELTPGLVAVPEDAGELLPPERQGLSEMGLAYGGATPRAAYAEWAYPRLVPTFTYRHTLLSRTLPNWVPWGSRMDYVFEQTDPDGWTRIVPPPDPAVRAKVRDQEVRRFAEFATLPVAAESAKQAYSDIANLVREHGIAVRLVTLPEGAEIRGVYPPEKWAAYGRFAAAVSADLGAEHTIARDWLPDSDFLDGHHILPDAAPGFTRRFGAEVLGPFLSDSESGVPTFSRSEKR